MFAGHSRLSHIQGIVNILAGKVSGSLYSQFIFFNLIFLLFFKYSFLPLPPTPAQPLSPPHLPPVSIPPPLLLSMSPL